MAHFQNTKLIPTRIISLVPSQTELLFYLGLDKEVVGITKFCIHPAEWFKTKARVGGTKKIDLEKIKQLQPDLIICNKEENEKGQVEELMKHYRVWMSDINNLQDALNMITSVGEITGTKEKARRLAKQINNRFDRLTPTLSKREGAKRVGYFIWKNPYMCSGKGTFIDAMLGICGFTNAFENSRYPELTEDDIKSANPDIIFLSSEPFPFKEKHVEEFKILCPNAKIFVVDGEIFSWYGSRLLYAPEYFQRLNDRINRVL